MAKYILEIFKHSLPIVWSWGFHNAVAIANGLRFSVQGFLFSGKVEVIYDEGLDTFIVRTLNRDGSIKTQVDDVYLDCLVNVIDGLVERCDGYENKVREVYGITA